MKHLLAILLSLLFAGPLGGEVQEYRISFSPPEISKGTAGGYDRFTILGLPLDNRPGAPLLPVRYVHLLMPPGARAVSVDVVYSDEKKIEGRFRPVPGRREVPLSPMPEEQGPEPDKSIYESKDIYPASQAELVHQGNLGGLGVATIKIYPLRYRGAERAIFQSTEVTILLRLANGKRTSYPIVNSVAHKMAQLLVEDLQHFDAWYPEAQKNTRRNESTDLLIITGAPFDTVLQRLADWKQRRGLVVEIALTDSIYSSVTGYDRQEKIRNFIRDRAQNNGISYVILGGDTAVVPARVTYAMASGYDSLAPGRDSLRADLYYSDLDGSWDADGDRKYGEIGDSVDMYPDVVVGRAPINTLGNAQTFVRKVMEYEQGSKTDFLNRASLWAEMLDHRTDGASAAEIIDRDHLSPFFKPAEKLYETLGNQTRQSTIATYRQGRHLINHVGHAWYTSLNVGPGFSSLHEIRAGDFDTIPTSGRWGIIYSIGCMAAAIERNCIAERYVNSSVGGGVAFIGNCSYGWYLPYFAGYGSSDRYNQEFFQKLLIDESPSLGSALATSKAHFIGAAQGENEYRWIMYGLNLIGDPTLAVWTEYPESLSIICSDSVPQGTGRLAVAVRRNGWPLSGAAVVLEGVSTFSRAVSDGSGHAVLPFGTVVGETIRLTVSAKNCLPQEKVLPVYQSGRVVSIMGWQVSEIDGNGDGLAGPGEVLALSFLVANAGSVSLGDSIRFILNSVDSTVLLLDSTFTVPSPAIGESIWTGPKTSFLSDSGLTDGAMVRFGLTVSDSFGTTWSYPVALSLAAPSPTFVGYVVDDRTGNGNGIPEAGEIVTIHVRIKNLGRAALDDATAFLSSGDPYLTVIDSTDSLGSISQDSVSSATFQIHLDQNMPGTFHIIRLLIKCCYGWNVWQDSFSLAAGRVGFSDDMESGASGWQAEGGWHLSTILSHSPSHSWYFGLESDSLMPQYSVDTLQTPAFIIGPACSLSWWQWYDFVPGSSWGVVEICGDFGARLLEVVEGRSGGWRMAGHDLSRYPAGSSLSLRFIAVCDSVRSEGWYIDDVNIFGSPTGTRSELSDAVQQASTLLSCHPNPARNRINIRFNLAQSGNVDLRIYNIQGQLVRILASGSMSVGPHLVTWDCRDGSGRPLANGLYFCRLSGDGIVSSRRLMIIR